MSIVEVSETTEAEVVRAISFVDDPEYPGVSIVDLGLFESVEIEDGFVRVGLIPTFSGCPALAMIAEDVRAQVDSLPGVSQVEVNWLNRPVWTVERMSAHARTHIATEFTVAVRVPGKSPSCPRCAGELVEQSMFGPSRCRSVSRCSHCGETVEVMRS